MAAIDSYDGIGVRIATHRKIRGLTQRGLALAANVNYSTLTKIESGHSMAQPAIVAAIARALSVNVTDLTGQPYLNELRQAKLEHFVEQLRLALDSYDLTPPEDVAARPTGEIEIEVALCCQDLREGLLGQVAARVPGLLSELTAVVAAKPEDEAAWRALFHGYDCVRFIASSWGFRDLAMLGLDRMGWSAARSNDPLSEAVRCYQRSLELMRSGHYQLAHQLIAAAFTAADQAPISRERTAVEGQVHLGAAITSARAGDVDDTAGHLDLAEKAAHQVGEVPAVYWLSFGPTNVAIHRVSAFVELDLFEQATQAASTVVIPSGWHATRVAHHHVDVARAHAWLGHHDTALTALRKARNTAPQRTRFHPVTRDTVKHLVETKRRLPENLASYARWVGL